MTKEELRNIRISYKWNQSYAAEMVGVSTRTWQRWESGQTKINHGLAELFIMKINVLKRSGLL
jgi:DNA-binding transcriptional regulator YiaG